MPSASSEAFLIILAASMCSILCAFSLFVVMVFHCCKVSNDVEYIANAARGSYMWARNSIFGRKSDFGQSAEELSNDPRAVHCMLAASPSGGISAHSSTGQFLKPPSCVV